MRIVLVTGGFDPLHSGHIEYFKAAKDLGDHLVVGVNSDEWLARKKGKSFLSLTDRVNIIKHLDMVDEVLVFNDNDDTANDAIRMIKKTKGSKSKIIFANGGDRVLNNIPEYKEFMADNDIMFKDNVGGIKTKSSSIILNRWKQDKVYRNWGFWSVLETLQGVKVKKLVIRPGQSLSNQKHMLRAEHWYVLQGQVHIDVNDNTFILEKNQTMTINRNTWHRAYNNSSAPCSILEVQYGTECNESDIERKDVNPL